jgi:hypothetical protein
MAPAISRQIAAQLLVSLRIGSAQTAKSRAISSRLPWCHGLPCRSCHRYRCYKCSRSFDRQEIPVLYFSISARHWKCSVMPFFSQFVCANNGPSEVRRRTNDLRAGADGLLGQLVFKRRNLFISPEGAGAQPHCVSPLTGALVLMLGRYLNAFNTRQEAKRTRLNRTGTSVRGSRCH